MGVTEAEATVVLDADERLYAPIEVAAILHLKTATVRNMCRSGRIQAAKQGKMWRVTKSEVKRYIQHGPRDIEEKDSAA